MDSKILHSNKTVSNYKLSFKIALAGLIISFYMFYYVSNNLPDAINFRTLFLDDFENRGLLLILALFGLFTFFYFFKKRNTFLVTEYFYMLRLEKSKHELFEVKRREKYILRHGIKKIQEKTDESYLILKKINEIKELEEQTSKKQSTNTTIAVPTSSVGSFAAHAGMPVETTTSISDYYETDKFVTYNSGEKEPFYCTISTEKIKTFLKI